MNDINYQKGIPDGDYYHEAIEKNRRKKQLRRTLSCICCMLLGTYLTVFVLLIIYYAVVDYMQAYAGFTDEALQLFARIIDVFLYAAQLAVPGIAYILLRKKRFWGVLKIDSDEEKLCFGPLSVLCFAACCFALACTMSGLSSIFTGFLGFDSSVYDVPVAQSTTEFIIDFISIAILPPLLEEFVFRGIILSELMPYGKSFAIVTSAVFFASVHGSIEQMIYSFVYGLLLAYIAVKTGSVLSSIVIHFLNNAYSCTTDYIEVIASPEIFDLYNSVSYAALIAVGLLCAVYLVGKNKIQLSERNDCAPGFGKLTVRDTFSSIASPVMIIYFIIVFFETMHTYLG